MLMIFVILITCLLTNVLIKNVKRNFMLITPGSPLIYMVQFLVMIIECDQFSSHLQYNYNNNKLKNSIVLFPDVIKSALYVNFVI